MTITIIKQQPGSWATTPRRQQTLATRVSAADWDGIFALAEDRHCGARGIIREALREYVERHPSKARGDESKACVDELRITVRGNNGSGGIIGKLVRLLDGNGRPTAGRHLPG